MTDEELRERFRLEVDGAGLELDAADAERLFAMWLEHRPDRQALRSVALEPDEEPLT